MQYCNNTFLLVFRNVKKLSHIGSILGQKYTEEKSNQIIHDDDINHAIITIDEYKHSGKKIDMILIDLSFPAKSIIKLVSKIDQGKCLFITSNGHINSELIKYLSQPNPIIADAKEEATLFPLIDQIISNNYAEKKLRLIQEIDSIFNPEIPSKEMTDQIVKIIFNELNYNICSIITIDYDTDDLIVRSLHGFGEYEDEYQNNFKINLKDRSLSTDCIKQKRQIDYIDIFDEKCNYRYKELARKIGLKSALVTPIFDHRERKRVLGTLNLYTTFPHKFQDAEKELIRVIAGQTALALTSRFAFRDEEIEKENQLKLLDDIAQSINESVGDPNLVFKKIVDGGRKLIDAQYGCIKIWDGKFIDRKYPINCVNVEYKREKKRKTDITSHVIDSKESIIIPDINKCKFRDTGITYKNVRSRISVPLLSKEEVIGILTVGHKKINYFTQDHLSLVETLAKHAVIAIEKTQEYNIVNRRLRARTVIDNLIDEVSKVEAIRDDRTRSKFQEKLLTDKLKKIIANTCKIYDAKAGFVCLTTFTSKYINYNPKWQYGLDNITLPPLKIAELKDGKLDFGDDKKSIVGKVVSEGEEYNCPDIENDDYYLAYNQDQDTKSEIVIPLNFQNQVIGALVLDSDKESAFSGDDVKDLKSIATQLAIFLKRYHYLNRLMDLTRPFKNIDNLDQLYNEIIDRTNEEIETNCCSIRLLDRDTLKIVHAAGFKLDSELPIKIGEGICGRAAEEQEVIIEENIQSPDSDFNYKDFAEANDLYGMMSAAILSTESKKEKRLLGVLNVYTNRIVRFTSLDTQIMHLIANKAGEAIKKAKLIQQLESISKIDKHLTQTSEHNVLQDIANIAKELMEADLVLLYQYKYNKKDNFGFADEVICSGNFIFKGHKTEGHFTKDSFVIKLVQQRENEFFIESFKSDKLIKELYRARHNPDVPQKFYERELLNSGIILKLTHRNELVGVLFINYRYDKLFSNEDKTIARTFANKISIAINNIRNYEAVNRLHGIGNAIVSESSINSVLNSITFNTFITMDADLVILYRYNESTREVAHPPFVHGDLRFPDVMHRPFHKNDVQFKVIEARRDIFASDVKHERRFSHEEIKNKKIKEDELKFADREGIKSCAALLLKVKNEIVGMMFINYRRRQKFDADQKRIMKILANQAALAIRNANLLDEKMQTIDHIHTGLNAIQATGNTIVEQFNKEKLEREDILQPLLDKALELIYSDKGYIGIVNEEKMNTKILVTSPNYASLLNKEINLYYPKQRWLKTRERYKLIDNVRDLSNELINKDYPEYNFLAEKEVKSALLVPIYSNHTVMGKIVIESIKENAFTLEDSIVIISLANQASLALQNFQLVNLLRELREVDSSILKKTLSLNDTFGIILRAALNLTAKRFGYISIRQNGNYLKIVKAIPDTNENEVMPTNQKTKYVFDTKKIEIHHYTAPGKKLISDRTYFIRSEILIPFILDKKPIGILTLQSEEKNDFIHEDLKLLEMLAGQAAVAISNAQLFQQNEEARKKLEKSIDSEILVGITKMQRTFEHRISNSVGFIRVKAMDLLAKKGVYDQKTRDALESILRNARKALDYPDEVTSKNNLSYYSNQESIDFKRIEADIKNSDEYKKSKNIRFIIRDLDKLPTIKANYKLLYEGIFQELITNAIKAMPDGGQITIKGRELRHEIRITVSDTGCGIPGELKEEIFKDGFTYWRGIESSGKGLYYMKSILEFFGGYVEVKSRKVHGTTFLIFLPKENKLDTDESEE
ncbi:GAF domain-containing protein [candidate division KSB1 bacterium]|nr:GAF domain-containing protein [candidate division KSB1 bacterium]